MIKALLKHLDAESGRAVADAWLKTIRTERDDLEDETRQIPLSSLHAALAAFVGVASRDAVSQACAFLVARDNLGGWTRVLRGTSNPGEAFNRLDATDSQYGCTTKWETLVTGPMFWRGRVHIAHDPAIEADGLLRLARMGELSVVPSLFGFGRGNVISVEAVTTRGQAQEFEVRWDVPSVARAGTAGAVVGGGVGLLPVFMHPSAGAWGFIVAGALSGGLVGLAWARDRARRVESLAQSLRVHTLERSLMLREAREAHASGALEGSVVAGQYRVVKRMGSGASGVIYEAVRASDGLPVAIKLLRTVAAHDAIASDRLRREAEALGLAWHPNVVEVIDHGLLGDGTSYLVMELLQGESLATRLKQRGKLTPDDLLPIAMQVCDALVAVHAAGVVHRDLKPSNIFLAKPKADEAPLTPRRTQVEERVKLLDFGIARVEWAETRITNMGAPVGTPGYMSPEQEAGGTVDARSDIFAFGAVLYECLVGEPPPPTPSGLWVASPAPGLSPVPRPDSALDRGAKLIAPEWLSIIERAMAPLPRDRYPDARALAKALRKAGEEMGRKARSSS
jgi:tRNA A-37 threonylcarbamoyl transferase component Bud32